MADQLPPPPVPADADLDARIEALRSALNGLLSERADREWPGLRASFKAGQMRVDDIAELFGMTATKVYGIARQCGWGRRPRNQSPLSRSLVAEKLKARWAKQQARH